jgi:hypothetical protein
MTSGICTPGPIESAKIKSAQIKTGKYNFKTNDFSKKL